MTRYAILFLIVLLQVVSPPNAGAEPRADHVVLISVDGFRPDFYLDESWPAPMIQQMAREGARAERVRGVFPTVTYPSHTTIVTGELPAKHGIYYNTPLEPEGQTGRWYWEEQAIQVPTLWDAVREHGGHTAAVSWPVTVGAPINWFIPEVWDPSPASEDRLKPMREGTFPVGLWDEIQREATGSLNLRTYSGSYIARDDKTGAAAAYLMETYKPTVLALHLISPDHFQHEEGRDHPTVRRALSAADSAISAVVEAAERAGILGRTAFIVTGDHGFVDVHTQFAPNVLLKEAGLTGPMNDRGDWRASFHESGGATFLHLQNPGDTAAAEQVRQILDAQPERIQKLYRIMSREELDTASAAPEAVFALAAVRGVHLSTRAEGDVVAPTQGGQHGYFPSDFPEIHTGFVAWGAGIRDGATVHEMGLVDIAPLVAGLIDIPFVTDRSAPPLGVLATTD